MFAPIVTERLVLRPVRVGDVEALVERRSDPEVARWQSWGAPYPRPDAIDVVDTVIAMGGPSNDAWWMLTIADRDDSLIYGDLALKLTNDGRTAEVGCTLSRHQWGRGIAIEALEGLLDWLFEVQRVTRVEANVHPDNLRSARVLEQCGFEFEGHTRNSYWEGDVNSDDWIYGLIPELRTLWAGRPQHRPDSVELIEPYPTGLRHVLELRTHRSQQHLVAQVAASLAQVAVPPIEDGVALAPWPRVIHADGEPVGFVMLAKPSATSPIPMLWRLLVDRRHQGRGIGSRTIDLVVEQARSWGSRELMVSWVPGVGSPAPLYLAKGFVPTGDVDDGEIVATLAL